MELETKIRESISVCNSCMDTNPSFGITMECRENSNLWLQITGSTLNMNYPFLMDLPVENLVKSGIEIPLSFSILEWNDGVFLTIDTMNSNDQEKIEFVLDYLSKVFKVSLNPENWIFSEI